MKQHDTSIRNKWEATDKPKIGPQLGQGRTARRLAKYYSVYQMQSVRFLNLPHAIKGGIACDRYPRQGHAAV